MVLAPALVLMAAASSRSGLDEEADVALILDFVPCGIYVAIYAVVTMGDLMTPTSTLTSSHRRRGA